MLSLVEATAYLKYRHTETLRLKANTGEIGAYKPAGKWLFDQQDLDDWIKAKYKKQKTEELCLTVERAPRTGGSSSQAYDKLLGRRTEKTRQNLKGA